MRSLSVLLSVIPVWAFANYYNVNTGRVAARLPDRIAVDGGIKVNPTMAELQAQGWVTNAVVPFSVEPGLHKTPGTRRYEYDAQTQTVSEVWDVETVGQKAERELAEKAAAIPDGAVAKYTAFYDVLSATIAAARRAGAEFPETIAYSTLTAALHQLEGDEWTRRAVILDALWNDVVYALGGTVRQAHDSLPLLEYRRQADTGGG